MNTDPGVAPSASPGPLSGLRILDLTRILAGPTCTQLFGDLGAEVLKIERPGTGDDTRSWGPPFVRDVEGRETRESAYFLCANRNKKSVAVDMAQPEGAALIRDLAGHCDVLVENFKVGGLSRYGLSYEQLRVVHPRLVYASVTGFGQTGPNAHRAGYDLLAQGYGGIMSLTGAPDGEPMKVAVGVADVVCGLYASTGILAALRHRDATGQGQHVDIALVDAQMAWLVNAATNYLLTGESPQRRGNQHPNIVPYQVFAAADGHVIVAVGNDSQFARFCAILDTPHLAEDERYRTNESRLRHRDELVALLADRIRTLGKDTLLAAMEAQGVPGGPINTLPEVFATDQAVARDMRIAMPHPVADSGAVDLVGNPLKLSESPVTYRNAPPMLGADTDETIRALLGEAALRAAHAAGILG